MDTEKQEITIIGNKNLEEILKVNWAGIYSEYLKAPEEHLSNYLRNGALLLSWMMLLPNPKRILEVGCGTSRASILIKLICPDAEVMALDIDKEICEIAKKYIEFAKVNIPVIEGDALSTSFPDNYFSVTFSAGVCEHFNQEDMERYLKEQLRIAPLTIIEIPLLMWYNKAATTWPGMRNTASGWINFFTSYSDINIANIHLYGSPGEEEMLLIMLEKKCK